MPTKESEIGPTAQHPAVFVHTAAQTVPQQVAAGLHS